MNTYARRFLIVLALAAAVVLAQWALIPLETTTRASVASVDEWRLPRLESPRPAEALDILARTSPWGAQATSPNLPDWHILAILARGTERLVVIRVGNQPEQRLKVGDALPGGSTILEIGAQSLCILVNGQKRMLALYQRGSTI